MNDLVRRLKGSLRQGVHYPILIVDVIDGIEALDKENATLRAALDQGNDHELAKVQLCPDHPGVNIIRSPCPMCEVGL